MMMRVPMYVQQVALGFLHSKFLSVVQTPKVNYCSCRNTKKDVYILTHWCVFTPKRRKFRCFRRLFGVKKTQCVNIHFFWCFYRGSNLHFFGVCTTLRNLECMFVFYFRQSAQRKLVQSFPREIKPTSLSTL